MKNIHISALIFFAILFVACEKSDNENTPEIPQDLIDKSLNYFDGVVIQENLKIEEGLESWEIKIQNSKGSIVNFCWTVINLSLLKIEGLTGPFDYEIQPERNLINFSTAKTVAMGALKNEAIEKWELEQEEDFIDKWIYTFEFHDDGGSRKVYIDAKSGDILQID